MDRNMGVREKPKGVSWTAEQWQAISAQGNNILVAAAAGSGKTAVLVERIIRKIIDTDDPVDVDRLLIVTFTNAAAAEMRQRIGAAIEQQLQKQPSSQHLRRQLSLLNRAHISTLHSFCLGIVRKFYYIVDMDPNFRIVEETEGELLREEVLEELFEEEYGKADNDEFYTLVDRYSGDRSDDDLRSLVRRVCDFSRSHPSPDLWLDDLAARYALQEAERIEDLPWTAELLNDVRLQLNGALNWIEKGLSLTKEPGGPHPYADNFADDAQQLRFLMQARDWMDLYERFQSFSFGKLKAIRKTEDIQQDLKEKAKAYRDRAKKQVQDLHNELFNRRPEAFLKDLRAMAPSVQTLVQLVQAFSVRYQALKREKALVDFADLEHLCLDILTAKRAEDGSRVPSEAALEYREHFAEVLIDEYQDTNLVQETILQLLSTDRNRFMVGDIKQSIYRFRLAEPRLFLEKYKRYEAVGGETEGWRIDLAKNFRSRRQVLDAVNFLFRQMMDEAVGEMAYDEEAELVLGNADYPQGEGLAAELALINKGTPLTVKEPGEEQADTEEELETAQLEARWIAQQVQRLIEGQHQVFDKQTQQMRNITYRDIVILMRSMPWAATMMEEFKQAGIPVYAELSGGYFEAVEVTVIMSLLKIIDNPYQDIPLASVLRSPIVGLNERELAHIRLLNRTGSFYEALKRTAQASSEGAGEAKLKQRAAWFCKRLNNWRTQARSGALSELIWQLFRETGYYDYVGGLPGGKQRQANLRALYDRARAYEETSFRGLFRFLRFIERMQERGDDLGTARALGEQEDVVRMLTIHKSKGLEFPVVFLAGMNKPFNMQDIRANVLLHKEWGLGSKYVDPHLRVAYSTLPQLAIKKRMHLESIAEEMRVLYVALTRAKEKVYLVGTLHEAEKSLEKWKEQLNVDGWLLPAADRSTAHSFLDWVGPAVLRHAAGAQFRHEATVSTEPPFVEQDPSQWRIQVIEKENLERAELPQHTEEGEDLEQTWQAVRNLEPVKITSPVQQQVVSRLEWSYTHPSATGVRSKQTVSELKREMSDEYSDKPFIGQFLSAFADRPRFLQKTNIGPAERGTAVHAVMQHIPLSSPVNREDIESLLVQMVDDELLTAEQADSVDVREILAFFETDLGRRLLASADIQREVPFSYGLPAAQVYRNWKEHTDEKVLLQGVVDCIFRAENGRLVLLDYKTDTISGRFPQGFAQAEPVLRERYGMQLSLYIRALEAIWQEEIQEAYLFFFDGAHVMDMKREGVPFEQEKSDLIQEPKEG